jgi:hypothetical protein
MLTFLDDRAGEAQADGEQAGHAFEVCRSNEVDGPEDGSF